MGSEFTRKIMQRHAREGDERIMKGLIRRDRTHIAGQLKTPSMGT